MRRMKLVRSKKGRKIPEGFVSIHLFRRIGSGQELKIYLPSWARRFFPHDFVNIWEGEEIIALEPVERGDQDSYRLTKGPKRWFVVCPSVLRRLGFRKGRYPALWNGKMLVIHHDRGERR